MCHYVGIVKGLDDCVTVLGERRVRVGVLVMMRV